MNQLKKLDPAPSHIYIIGAGGVASHLLPTLIKLLKRCDPMVELTIMDGDKLEERNLDRQLFPKEMVGMYKAQALAALFEKEYPVLFVNEWFLNGTEVVPNPLFMSCVDNHTARRAILSTVDRVMGYAILGGNEETDAESLYYDWSLSGSKFDPRIFYPEILTDTADDPVAAEGCTGEETLNLRPQLALANMGAAYYMLHQFWFYFTESRKMGETQYFPVKHHNNFSRCGTVMRLNMDNNGQKEPNESKEKAEKA